MTLRTFSYGGGVQSTAALVLAAQGRIDYPTFLFCNVGDDSEHPATITYVEEVAKPYAAAHGIDLIELRRVKRTGQEETLWGRLTKSDSRSLPIPVRMSNGAPGTRSCTADFKIRLVAKWLREHGATAENPAVTGLGISIDEIERARTDSGFDYQTLTYPLLDLRLTRSDCMRIISDAGLPVPGKSACFFCPFHTPERWRVMRREEPALFAKAVELERLLNERRVNLGKDPVWLTRFNGPLDEVLGHAGQGVLDLDGCDQGFCFT